MAKDSIKNSINGSISVPRWIVPIIIALVATLIGWNSWINVSLADRPNRIEVNRIVDRSNENKATKADILLLKKDIEHIREKIEENNNKMDEVLKEVKEIKNKK